MDCLVTLKLPTKQLKRLNRSRIYLQVIHISDICSADEKTILNCFKRGDRCPHRHSTLDWPFQPKLPRADWLLWAQTLHHLEDKDQLATPLGQWVQPTHQTWSLLFDRTSQKVLLHHQEQWLSLDPITTITHHTTRSATKAWYDITSSTPAPIPDLAQLIPASAMLNPLYHDSLFCLSTSDTPLPQPVAALNPRHIQSHPDGSASPHPFYQKQLKWNKATIERAEKPLVDAISTHNLHICADGAFLKEHGQGSHAWVFSDGSHQEIWKGAGPTFGHTDLMTPYRAELSGLTLVLFVLQWVCSQNAIGDGKVMIYCDNEAALN
jgi:hypothetical protein